jgi:leukotriene-A4 hydrolase
MKIFGKFLFLLLFFSGCFIDNQRVNSGLTMLGQDVDLHSFANISAVKTEHINLDLTIDFEKKMLFGSAEHYISHQKKADFFNLDIRDLMIDSVTIDGKITKFEIGPYVEYFGQCLSINIEKNTEKVKIFYKTSPQSAALQWIDPEKTAGGNHPFLYSQSQAILARSWIPIQDAPSVKFTYAAQINTPEGLMALMSAENPQKTAADGRYFFRMDEPVSSYLMALAVGKIEFKELGENTGVYAEPVMLNKAIWEFEEIQAMVYQAEELYGEYKWGRFDVLIMPPSFPFGGMENPRLTFATPTILAGDKSLVSLIAHELAHSWSGNLVTNETWNDFWLNEGFTVYFESRIMEKIYGRPYDEMLKVLGLNELKLTLQHFEENNQMKETHLFLNLEGRDPDEGLTDIAYEKGRFFLFTLENLVGRTAFDVFLNQYFDSFAFQTSNTEKFIRFLNKHLLTTEKLRKQANINAWIYGPGIPKNFPGVISEELTQVEKLAQQLNKGDITVKDLKVGHFTTQHWLHFLRSLKSLEINTIIEMENRFQLSSQNAEIACDWFLVSLNNGYFDIKEPLKNYLLTIGRRKFVAPLFRAIVKHPEMKAWAKEWYPEARKMYHSITYQTVDEILKEQQ